MPAPLELSRPDSTTPSRESQPDTPVQTIPLPPRPWTKFIAAFAGGVACTFLLTTFITFSSTPRKPEAETSKLAQRTQGGQPAKPAPTPPPAARASDPAPQTKDAAADRTPASDEASGAQTAAANETADADAGKSDRSCAQQTWPYVNHGCAGADPQGTRSVRVISSDRGAPSTVTTTAPAKPAARTTDGLATPDARAAKAARGRETTGSSPSQASVALQPQPPARTESPTPPAADDSTAKPKPEAVARTEETTPSQASSTEMVKRVPLESSATAEDTRPTSRSRDRHERRYEARKDRGKREAGENRASRSRDVRDGHDNRNMRDGGDLRASRASPDSREANDDDAPRARASQEEVSPRSRAANDNGQRDRRPRSASNEDDDGYTLVRSQRTRDGGRVTVHERPIEREAKEEAKETVRERAPSTPFFFNPAGTSGY
jgi:hypothetical protein